MVGQLKSQLMGLAAAAGIGLSVNALKNYVSGTIDVIAQSNALATRIGWSAEAFQKMSYVARKSAVDQEELAISLGHMSKRIGEVAIEGKGPAADVLKRFGIQAKDLAAMGPEKAFGAIVKIFEQIHNPMERSAVAMDLFGKSGQAMIQIMAKGGPEIERLKDMATKTGFALSAIDNEKALQAKSALVDLSLAAEGFANMLAVKVAPYITIVIEKYTEWAYSGTKSADWISNGMKIVAMSIGTVVDAVYVLEAGFHGLIYIGGKIAEVMVGQFQGVLSVIQLIIDGPLSALQSVGGLISASFAEAVGKVRETLDSATKGVAAYRAEIGKGTEEAGKAAVASLMKVGSGRAMVKGIMDDIEGEATKKAKESAAKKEKFLEPGPLNYQRPAIGFASAEAQAGTAAAHSAILQSKGLQINAQANMAMDTKNTAENTGNLVNVANAIHRTLVEQGAKANIPATPGKI